MRGPTTITIADADALDDLPDETLIRASGRYASGGGTFTDCWARPIPEYVAGTVVRAWEVLVYGDTLPYNLALPEDFTYPVTVLFTDPTNGRGVIDTGYGVDPTDTEETNR